MNVFIDLGSHYGAILRKFIASPLYTPDCIIHAFEANPVITDKIFSTYPDGTLIHEKAAWTYNGTMQFFINKNPAVQGSSAYKEKITGNLDKEHPVLVKCIDFSQWMKENFDEEDSIIVKSNIEGAEYPLFSKMLQDGTINLIDKLYLRRHWHKIGMSKEQDDSFMEELRKVKSLTIYDTYTF